MSSSQSVHAKIGFAVASQWIAQDHDNEALVFRKFDEIGTRNLLYLQAEILVLERKLEEMDRDVLTSGKMTLKDAARTWEVLVEQAESGVAEAKIQMTAILELRKKIREYHKALLLQSQVAGLGRPNERVLQVLTHQLSGGAPEPDGRKPFPMLGGHSKDYLDSEWDLVSLKPPSDSDHLSRFLRRYWPVKTELSRDGIHKIGRSEERHIMVAAGIINFLVGSVLLIGPIIALSLVSSPAVRIGMIAGFTGVSALSIILMTNARRTEIFAATAAYAAVLVVFASNGGVTGGQSSP